MPVAEKVLLTTKRSDGQLIYARSAIGNGHTLQLFGYVSPGVLKAVEREYVIESDDDDYVDVTKDEWFKDAKRELHHGGLIRVLRGHRGMSQGDLGKHLGVTSKYVSDLELGRRPVSVKIARKLSEVFGRRPERFLPLD